MQIALAITSYVIQHLVVIIIPPRIASGQHEKEGGRRKGRTNGPSQKGVHVGRREAYL